MPNNTFANGPDLVTQRFLPIVANVGQFDFAQIVIVRVDFLRLVFALNLSKNSMNPSKTPPTLEEKDNPDRIVVATKAKVGEKLADCAEQVLVVGHLQVQPDNPLLFAEVLEERLGTIVEGFEALLKWERMGGRQFALFTSSLPLSASSCKKGIMIS